MVSPTSSIHHSASVAAVVGSTHAGSSEGPKQRLGFRAKMDAFSHSVAQKGRHLKEGFKARPGDASSTPRSSRAQSPVQPPQLERAQSHASGRGDPPQPPEIPAPTPPVAPPVAAPPHAPIELSPRLTMRLEDHRLIVGEPGRANRTEQLLDSVLNKTQERYRTLENLSDPAVAGKTEYLLTDSRHRLLHAQASDLAVSVFKSSENRPYTRLHVAMPGNAHRAQITGVHVDADGNAFRLHDKKLYALEEGTWKDRGVAVDLKSLHDMGGELYALDDAGQIRPLSAPDTTIAFQHPVQALAHLDGALIALTADSDNQLHLERRDGLGHGIHGIHALTDANGPLSTDAADKPTAIAVQGNQVLLSTATGTLHRVNIPDDMIEAIATEEETRVLEPLSLADTRHSDALQNLLGRHQYGEMFVDNNQLFARVKDHRGTEHSASWDAHSQTFRPGWNLSQTLVLDRQHGLPRLTPALNEQIQLARGRIAQHDNTLLAEDPRTGEWKKTSETDIKSLVAAHDGFAYLIDKDNKLKQLKVAPQATAHDMGQGVDLALPGRATEAKGTLMRGAEHLTVDKVAVQNDQRYMTLSGGELRLHDQNGERAKLPPLPGNGDIIGIGSSGQDWFALKDGALHQMSGPGADPKNMSTTRAWATASLEGLPAGATLQDLKTDHKGHLRLHISVPGATPEDPVAVSEHIRRPNGRWEPASAEAEQAADAAPRPHAHFENLAGSELPFTRKKGVKLSANIGGRNNVETAKLRNYAPNSLTQNYVTSHLASTGAFKVPADSIQHAWKGREGLREVYTREVDTLRGLTAAAAARPAEAPDSMADRLATLSRSPVSPPVAELVDLITWFQRTVNEDMQKTLRELAEAKGALHNSGDINLNFRPGKPPRNDLFNEVAHVLTDSGIKPGDPLGDLVETLQSRNFTLEHRDPVSSFDDSRKRGDNQTLLCARLAANAQIMKRLSAQVDDLTANPGRPQADLDTFAAQLAALHNTDYDGNPLKRYTDAGFRSYGALEASYDATKSLLKYMRKDNHPVKRNVLEGLQTTPAELTRNLTQALRDLEPRESLKINRNYGGGVTGGISGPAGDAFLGFRGSVDPERTYGITFTRFDRGLKVSINREGAVSGTGSFGFGGGKSDTKTTAGDSHNNIQSNSGWFGGSLDAKYKYADNTALSFFVRDDEMDAFMDDLLNTRLHSSQRPELTGLKPMDLMNRSVEQEVRTTAKHSFDLELGANIESRTNYGQTDAEPVAGFMRFGVGLLASLTLMSAERERTQGRGNDGLQTDIYSSNRARFLEKGAVTGYARMFSSVFSARPDNLFIAGGAPVGIAATLSVDNKTGKTYDVRFKDALPVQASDVKSLASSLEKAFPELKQNKRDDQPVTERLNALHDQYGSKTAQNDAQHSALMSLAQTRRQQLANVKGSALMSLMDMVVKHNNVNRVDQKTVSKRGIDMVKEMLGKDVNPGNAERIHQMMNDDPQLKALLDEMKSAKGTTRAEIKLEVTDAVKKNIEDAAIVGRLSDEALKTQLSDRDNLRIKSIAIFRSAAKDDSLGVPLPYVSYKSGSSLAIERLMGELTFEYGADQLNPKKVTADGAIADQGDTTAARELGLEASGEFRLR
ncbi:AvrE-family type 3 secretion system effector [Pseudomonas sp. Pseu.R1]|uniref:AvrE-family type 3 secretion system effector n=1 Tax=Pseudomonas sp. Pseu.R1 TaxID=3379818 RepID=UPI003B923363